MLAWQPCRTGSMLIGYRSRSVKLPRLDRDEFEAFKLLLFCCLLGLTIELRVLASLVNISVLSWDSRDTYSMTRSFNDLDSAAGRVRALAALATAGETDSGHLGCAWSPLPNRARRISSSLS